jgi:signal transduction histidine kinase
MVPIDVVKSVEYARQMLSYRIEGLHLNVSLIYDEREVYSVFGLRSEFEQILMILINNAIDAIVARFGKEERTAEGVIGIRVAVHDGITVTVEDNGIGIDPAIATRIFEPYFTTKDQGEGVGMGLYIAKLILENHMHGSLRYEKRDGKTVFIIRMEID